MEAQKTPNSQSNPEKDDGQRKKERSEMVKEI